MSIHIILRLSIVVLLILGCEDKVDTDSANSNNDRYLKILIYQEVDSTSVDTLYSMDAYEIPTMIISVSNPGIKEIDFNKSEHPELPFYILRYNDLGTLIYWLEGEESSDGFPHWEYESWQARCLTSSGVYYGADSINAKIYAFLIDGTVNDRDTHIDN